MAGSAVLDEEMSALDARIPIVLLAGQSNAVGLALTASAPDSPLANTWLYEGDSHGDLRDAWGDIENGSTFGPEWGLSNEYAPLAVVKYAVGATNLYEDWIPGGDVFEDWEDATIDALAELDGCGIPYSIKAFVWVQGEADASSTQENAENYKENLDTQAADVRATFGNIEYIVVELKTLQGDWDQTIRDEQAAFVAADGNATLIDTDALSTSDGVHYDTPSMFTLGELIAAEVAP